MINMKKIIALTAALIMVFSLTGCFGMGNNNNAATADEAKAGDISTYDKDFDGLVKYISDNNANSAKQEIYYDILGAKNGVRFIFSSNPYVEVYDFSNITDGGESAHPETASFIIDSVKAAGKFRPIENGAEMTAVITDSGKYVIAWDATRNYDYAKKVATDDLIKNW